MKKILLVLLSIIVLLIASILIFPSFYKSKVIELIDGKIAQSINATLNYDRQKVQLSLIKDFPNISLSLHDLSIVGKGIYEYDTLLGAKEFQLTVDIKSAFSDKLELRKIKMIDPLITIIFGKDGSANYDIYIEDETAVATEESASTEEDFVIAFQSWEMENGRLVYKDYVSDMFITAAGVNHKGSGDFSQNVFDMDTYSVIEKFNYDWEGVSYMSNKRIEGDLIMNMDIDQYIFKFKENEIRINDFAFSFDGFFAMPEEGYDMDINFKTKNNTFKSFLSLVPGMYADGFENLQTKGTLEFGGFVKGMYTDDKMPAWDVNLIVKDGFVKSPDIPLPIENIQLALRTASSTGEFKDGLLDISNFSLLIDKETFTSKIAIKDFDNPAWDVNIQGALNLDVVSSIMPVTDFSLAGRINANIQTKGVMADLEAERYDRIYSSGNVSLKNLTYSAEDIGIFSIADAAMDFSPKDIRLEHFDAKWGKSDFQMNGALNNYMAYALKGEVIKGNLNFNSKLLDLNNMMAMMGEEVEETDADTTGMAVVAIPKNLDFTLIANINRVEYDQHILQNVKGNITIKEGVVHMDKLNFGMLGGNFILSGIYDTEEIAAPLFSFDMQIERMDIKKAYESFVTVQKLAPIAEHISGSFSTNFKIGGLLEQNMMPDLSTLTGAGLIRIANAIVSNDSHLVSGISSLSKIDNNLSREFSIKNVSIKAEIENGRLYIEPFVAQFGNYATTIGGSSGIDGSIDYLLALNIPSGAAGQAFNSAVSSIIGSNFSGAENIVMNVNMGGTYLKPDFKLGKVETAGGSAKSAIQGAIATKIEEEKAQIMNEIDKQKAEAEKRAKEEADKIKAEAEKRAAEEKEKLKEEAKNRLKKIIGG